MSYSEDGAELTPRQRDVLYLAACGASRRETARELHVSEETVKTLRSAAVARLRAPNWTAAVARFSGFEEEER